MISLGSRLIACCKLAPTLARQMWRHNYVIDRNEFLHFQNLSILGYTHGNFCLNPQIIHGYMKENVSGCFFSEHSVHIGLGICRPTDPCVETDRRLAVAIPLRAQRFIQPPRRGGELPLKQSYSPWRTINSPPPQGSTCFDDQLTRPLHANLLLQHETDMAFILLNKKAVLSQR